MWAIMKKIKNQVKSIKRKSSEISKSATVNKKNKTLIEEKEKKLESSEDEAGEELREPTAEELKQSVKPENIYSIPSIREKQKQKHKKIIEQKQNKNKLQNKGAIETYLKTWKEDRSNWKYKKLLQVEIVSKMFDIDVINDEIWPLTLEYLSGTEGKAKTRIIEMTEKEISKLDEQIESGNKELLKCTMYIRARELLQNLN